MADSAQALFEAVKEQFAPYVEGLANLKWENLPSCFIKVLKENPKLNTAQVLLLLVYAIPGLSITALCATGFCALGPVAGSIAALLHSWFGATWLFSLLQSAAMGGWGVAYLKTILAGMFGFGELTLDLQKIHSCTIAEGAAA